MNDEQPSYYAIIPASVRYDGKLSSAAKLLYGEITALCNKSGYCWATNAYFAKLYGVTTRSASSWLSQLENGGYITMRGSDKRKIFIGGEVEGNVQGDRRKLPPPLEENFKHNITSNITYKKYSSEDGIEYKSMQDLVPQFMAALGVPFPAPKDPSNGNPRNIL